MTLDSIYKRKITGKHTNPQQEANNKFHLKSFMNKLPTLDVMFKRYPHLYPNNIYPVCKESAETNTYVFMCQTRKKNTLEKLHIAIIKAISKFSSVTLVTKITNDYIKPSNLFKIDPLCSNTADVTKNSTFSITDTIRFLIPKSLTYHIRTKLKANHQTVKAVIVAISWNITKVLKEIWELQNIQNV